MMDLLNKQWLKIGFQIRSGELVEAYAEEPQRTVASDDVCQVKQYSHVTKNGIRWNVNPSQSQWE